MDKFIFNDFDNLLGIFLSAPIVYVLVIIYLRIVGIRATSQLNSFDWIVTVAIGSFVGSTIILESVSIYEGGLAIVWLVTCQFILTRLVVRFPNLHKWVRSSPQLMVYNGDFLKENMRKSRVVENEILHAMRRGGIQNIDEVHAVVFETDATFSVISKKENNSAYTIAKVQGIPEGLKKELEKRDEVDENLIINS